MRQGAIFDMDGLLLDTERLYQESWIEAMKAFGLPVREAFTRAISGTSGESMERVIRQWFPEADPQAFKAACMDRACGIMDRDGPELKPGARELLSWLRGQGVRIAAASSSGRDRIFSNLRMAGLLEFFDEIVSGQEVQRGKPDPDIFLLAAERIGCAPGDCWVFEDSVNGVRAALAAGSLAVMVPDLTPPPEDLEGFIVCESLLEARDRIQAGEL